MATQSVHLELLLGTKVRDTAGAFVGRIEEVRAERQGDTCVVAAYMLGRVALLDRLSAWTIGLSILHLFGARKINQNYTVPWDKLDLSDPTRPRLRCTVEELRAAHEAA